MVHRFNGKQPLPVQAPFPAASILYEMMSEDRGDGKVEENDRARRGVERKVKTCPNEKQSPTLCMWSIYDTVKHIEKQNSKMFHLYDYN